MRCAECRAQIGEVTGLCPRCGAPIIVLADPADGLSSAPGVGPVLESAGMEPADSYYQTSDAVSRIEATASSEPQPPIRKRLAFAGAGTALLSGVAGVIWSILFNSAYNSGFYQFTAVTYLLLTVVAIVALARINRLLTIGLLQGMCWPTIAFVAADTVAVSVDHFYRPFAFSARYLAAYWTGITSDVLGVIAVVLLAISLSEAASSRRAPHLGPVQVILLCGVGLSQIAAGIFYATEGKQATAYTLAIAGWLVGLAVAWYAVTLQVRALGGVLVLGWAAITALSLLGSMSSWTVSNVAGCLLFASVMILAFVYTRGPSDLAPGHSPLDP